MDWLFGSDISQLQTIEWAASQIQVLGGALCVSVGLYVLWKGRSQGGNRISEMIIWVLVGLLLVLMNAEPMLISEVQIPTSGKTVVLVDSSASMSVQSANTSRFQRANKLVAKLQEQLTGTTEIWYFDGALNQTEPSTTELGHQSDILQALRSIRDRYLGQELQGIILLTDGIDRGALGSTLGDLPDLPGPLSIIQLEETASIYDEAVVGVESGGFAFQRLKFSMKAHVRGEPNGTLTVELRKNNQAVSEQKVSLDSEGKGEALFDVRPLEVGRYAWDVVIPVQVRDVVPSNNYFPIVIKVVRDEVRVLQVCGSPSYDQKFLRLFLKEDPSVDLISFFILRTHDDLDSNWDSDELSLIAFPYEKLFTEELETFDLVVFQNFNYQPFFGYQSDILLGNIADYVRAGGSFVMIGGDRSFDLGEYGNTPIEEILPINLGTENSSGLEPFVPVLTNSGQAHPLTKLAAGLEANQAAWKQLPEMDGFNRVASLKPNAASLLEHPTAKDDAGQPSSILSVQEVEKGRVMALNVDSSWRWSYSEALEGEGNQAYLRFWKNALRWLIADPDDAQAVIQPSRENTLLGEEMTLTFRTRNTEYMPAANQILEAIVTKPDGQQENHTITTNQNGVGELLYTPNQQGIYQVRAVGRDSIDVNTVFAVSARIPELDDIQPNVALMKQMANQYTANGMDAIWMSEHDEIEPILHLKAERTIVQRSTTPLALAPIWFLILVPSVFGAIMIRRRSGGR